MPTEHSEEFWRKFLESPDSFQRVGRHVFRRIPSNPRCRICAAPFSGAGAPVMRLIGKRPSVANPNYCNACESFLMRHHGGAEVRGAMLMADIRGSTALAEGMSTREFRALLDRFYDAASGVVFEHDGMVDKFVGDELVAVFPPNITMGRQAARAVETGVALLRATGHGSPEGPWVSIGAGVHEGRVWFGAVGDGSTAQLTVVGDPVNVTARLAALAEPGEVLVSADAATAAGLDPSLPRRTLELKGRTEPIEVVSLGVRHPIVVA